MLAQREILTIPAQLLEELTELPFDRCVTCGKAIGHLRQFYLELIRGGANPQQVFEVLRVPRYCCRGNISNPARIAPGLIYNNPRQAKVEIADEETAKLLGQLTVKSEMAKTLAVAPSAVLKDGTDTVAMPLPDQPESVLPSVSKELTIQKAYPSVSTAYFPGTSITRTEQQPADALILEDITTAGQITADFLPENFEAIIARREAKPSSRTKTGRSAIPGLVPRPTTLANITSDVIPPLAPLPPTSAIVSEGGEIILGLPPPRELSRQPISRDVFLPTTRYIPDPQYPGQLKIISQYSGL